MTDRQFQQNKGYGKYLQLIFTLCDYFVLNVAILISLKVWPTLDFLPSHSASRLMWIIANLALLPTVYFQRQLSGETRAIQMERVIPDVFFTVGVHVAILLSVMMFVHVLDGETSRYFEYFYLYFFSLLLVTRIVTRFILKHFRRKGRNIVKVVIIGTGETAKRLYEAMQEDEGFGFKVLGFFGEEDGEIDTRQIKGSLSSLKKFMETHEVQQIYYTLSGDDKSISEIGRLADSKMIELFIVPQISRYFTRRYHLKSIGPVAVLSTMNNPLNSVTNRIVKRGFDLAVSSIFLIFYPLIYVPVALAIKFSSPGPVYFRQKRTGYLGNDFDCLKFRTMKVNTDSDKRQATADDPRKTKIGDFLRRTSLDELPQFINVFKGDMSVVGPRPHMLKHTEEYSSLISNYMIRHAVKPGITGWAQVNGYRGPTDQLWKMQKRVEYDVWYIEHWTLLLDIKIMFRTVWNAFHGEKNAF